MAPRFYINTSKEASLLAGVGSADVTFNLSGSGLVNVPATPFTIRIDPDTSSEEVCLVTGGSATSLTVTRGFDGTTPTSHLAGAKVRHVVIAEFFNKADAHVEASADVHGLSGGAAVVGTSQSQTLTNKTLSASVTDLAHTTSPAASQAHRVHANDATARNGFVWDNTGGSTGKAFLAKVAGVDKTYIEGDGDVVVGGTTNTTGLTNTGNLTNTGQVTTATLNATGAVDFDSTLNVDGTVGLNADTTIGASARLLFTVPPGAHGVRHLIRANSNSIALGIYDHLGSDNFYVYGNGEVHTDGRMEIYDQNSSVIAVVPSTASVASPQTDDVVFDLSTGTVKRYTGVTWAIVGYYGKVGNSGFARYRAGVAQTINNGVVTAVQFPTADNTTADVTASGAGNSVFTLNRTGVWRISANLAIEAPSGGNGYRALSIGNTALTTRYAEQSMTTSSTSATLNVSVERPFTAAQAISVAMYHESGANKNTLAIEELVSISLTWLRP